MTTLKTGYIREDILEDNNVPWIASQSRMMKCIESIIVCECYIGRVIQQQRQDVITLFTDGIV